MKKELGPYDTIPCASKYVGERVIDVHKKKPNYFEKWFNTNPNYPYYVDVAKLNVLLKQNSTGSELRRNRGNEVMQASLPSKRATKVPISESKRFAYRDPDSRYVVYDTSKNAHVSEDGSKAYLPDKVFGITQCLTAKPGTRFFGDSYKYIHNHERILFSDEGEKIAFVGMGFGIKSIQLQFMTYEYRNPMRVRICDMRINGIRIVNNSRLEKNCLDTIVIHDETTKIRTSNITFIPGDYFNFHEVKEIRMFLYVEKKQTVYLSDELVLTLNHSSRDYYANNEFYEDVVDYSEWNEESILMKYGYNVSQKEGLTDIQRQNILIQVIESRVLSKNEIIKHIEKQINLRKNNIDYYVAVAKWKRDIEFVQKYTNK